MGSCQSDPAGLSLEGDGGENNFLETLIINTGNNLECRHRNKNANMGTQEFYRGKYAWSYNDERHKMGAMIGKEVRRFRMVSPMSSANARTRSLEGRAVSSWCKRRSRQRTKSVGERGHPWRTPDQRVTE